MTSTAAAKYRESMDIQVKGELRISQVKTACGRQQDYPQRVMRLLVMSNRITNGV
ncbi:MAG: hypothetical protein ACTTJN_07520 [Prevotella intermedia]